MGDEQVGEEGREKIEEEDEHDDLHGIERCVEVFCMLDILSGGDKTYDVGIVHEEETGDSDSEYEEYLVGLCNIAEECFRIHLLDSLGKEWEHGVEEEGPEHHPDFHDLHGN